MSENQYFKNEAKINENENFIIGYIKVAKNDLKQRIIYSYENARKEGFLKGIKNEEEIKTCEIFINNKKIDFTYYYEFPNEGNYKIKYVFKQLLNSTNYMFYGCNSLLSLDLSNFNTQNVIDMHYIFRDCKSFIKL